MFQWRGKDLATFGKVQYYVMLNFSVQGDVWWIGDYCQTEGETAKVELYLETSKGYDWKLLLGSHRDILVEIEIGIGDSLIVP